GGEARPSKNWACGGGRASDRAMPNPRDREHGLAWLAAEGLVSRVVRWRWPARLVGRGGRDVEQTDGASDGPARRQARAPPLRPLVRIPSLVSTVSTEHYNRY